MESCSLKDVIRIVSDQYPDYIFVYGNNHTIDGTRELISMNKYHPFIILLDIDLTQAMLDSKQVQDPTRIIGTHIITRLSQSIRHEKYRIRLETQEKLSPWNIGQPLSIQTVSYFTDVYQLLLEKVPFLTMVDTEAMISDFFTSAYRKMDKLKVRPNIKEDKIMFSISTYSNLVCKFNDQELWKHIPPSHLAHSIIEHIETRDESV